MMETNELTTYKNFEDPAYPQGGTDSLRLRG